MLKKILYVRSGPYQPDINGYNLQEIGLARALYDYGYQCDIVYYHKKKNFEQIIEKNGVKIKIYWRKGIKVLRTGIYPSILKKEFLNQYDAVICSEYSQIMSYLLSKRCKNFYIYNGPYYNLFKIPFMEKIYDFLFCKKINKNVKCVFCKTKLSEEYINKKGITKTTTVGVGLDLEKFNNDIEIKPETQKILDCMEGKRNILYIGSIINRKNTEIIIKTFLESCKKHNDIQLILIGKGNDKYVKYCHSLIPDSLNNRIKWFNYIENSQTKYVYKKSSFFVLPSKQEIFGMVLLEAMYYELPVISSSNAGALTLINKSNGMIVRNFNILDWNNAFEYMLDNNNAKNMGLKAKETVENKFMWSVIVKKMITIIKNRS